MRDWLILCWRLWKLRNTPTWLAARQAVEAIKQHSALQTAATIEPRPSFCPMCGQIPDGDRRMDHARSVACAILKDRVPSRSELDAALALYYWRTK